MADPARPEDSLPITSFDDLLAPLHAAMRPRSEFVIGAEAEKFGVLEDGGAPIAYEGERGVRRVLEELAERFDWQPAPPEQPGGPLLALTRADGASVTLEPGSQLELSGAPLADIHLIADETDAHLVEVAEVAKGLGIRFLGIGFHPYARQEDLTWVPKTRYGVMQRWLPTRGAHGLDMMRRTATVQANFDYESETSAMRALRVSLKLSPFITAMFANSPFYEGRAFGGKSYRARAWLDVEPSRQGLVPNAIREGSTFTDYVEWALDAPMFLVMRPSGALENTGQTFRSFWREGFQGERATRGDWLTHLNTMFPEVRLKKTLEVRGGDSQGRDLALALPALWTGILYDERALGEMEALLEGVTHDELVALRPQVADHALAATFRGVPVAAMAEKILQAASDGLIRRGRVREGRGDESTYLTPLARLVERGRCPADDLLDRVGELARDGVPGGSPAFRRAVAAAAHLA
jgi:glutamate--cysteine ligase